MYPCVFFSETPLNTETPLIRTIWPVPLVSVLTGFHCIEKMPLLSQVVGYYLEGEPKSNELYIAHHKTF